MRWDNSRGFYVQDLKTKKCKNAAALLSFVALAAKNRRVSAHVQNQSSSRSHCIVRVEIESIPLHDGEGLRKQGSICFVDLAGSERIKETGAEGIALKEAAHINKSLYTLGQVIGATLKNSKLARSHSGGSFCLWMYLVMLCLPTDMTTTTTTTTLLCCMC